MYGYSGEPTGSVAFMYTKRYGFETQGGARPTDPDCPHTDRVYSYYNHPECNECGANLAPWLKGHTWED